MTADKILDKLAKMRAARDGERAIGNEEASQAFADAINRLLLQHDLSEAEIPASATGAKEDPIVEINFDFSQFEGAGRYDFKRVRSAVPWQGVLAAVVAEANLCRVLGWKGSNAKTFVGTKAHCEAAAYSYGVLASTAARLSNRARGTYWSRHGDEPNFKAGNYRAGWLTGFVQRVNERYREIRRRETAGASSTALVRLDGALVRAQDYINQRYKPKTIEQQLERGAGYHDGVRAANELRLGQKGVGNGATAAKKIGGGR